MQTRTLFNTLELIHRGFGIMQTTYTIDAMYDAIAIANMRDNDTLYVHITGYGSHVFDSMDMLETWLDISQRYNGLLYAIRRVSDDSYVTQSLAPEGLKRYK